MTKSDSFPKSKKKWYTTKLSLALIFNNSYQKIVNNQILVLHLIFTNMSMVLSINEGLPLHPGKGVPFLQFSTKDKESCSLPFLTGRCSYFSAQYTRPLTNRPISPASSPTIPHFKLDLLAILYWYDSSPNQVFCRMPFEQYAFPLFVLLTMAKEVLQFWQIPHSSSRRRTRTKTFYWLLCQWVGPTLTTDQCWELLNNPIPK